MESKKGDFLMNYISPVPEKLILSPEARGETKATNIAAHIEESSDDAELRKACADFEALFLHKLMQTMRKTIPKSGLLHGGLPQEIYTDMLDEKISETAASAGKGTGLGERLYEDMKRAYGNQIVKSTGIYNEASAFTDRRKE